MKLYITPQRKLVWLDSVTARIYAFCCALDSYGYPVLRFTRHRDCHCRIPCQKTFNCLLIHRGDRATPWCNGASVDECDPANDWCDACAVSGNLDAHRRHHV